MMARTRINLPSLFANSRHLFLRDTNRDKSESIKCAFIIQHKSLSDSASGPIDARERARRKIAELEEKESLSPNSPIGIMNRTPHVDPNATAENEEFESPEQAAFKRFKDGINPETGEVNGPTGPEPTRFGDWERKGRCSDF